MSKLDHHSVIPLYHQLKEILRENIESHVWNPNDLIPSEHQLIKEYNVSRNTVKKAIEELAQEGLLNRIQGKGTFVSRPKLEQSLSRFYSFSNVLKEKGLNPTDKIISIEKKVVKPSIAKVLQLKEGELVIELKRLRCADDQPIILETSYIPVKYVDELTEEMLDNQSLYDLMQEKYGIVVTKAKEIFEPVLIRNYEKNYLKTKEGMPALLLDRIASDSDGNIVEFCRSVVRGDSCRFYTELL